jgi:hypothetical protein
VNGSELAGHPTRTTRTASLNNQRISRQAILSSTWPANHHRTSRVGKQAGQRHYRVSGRDRTEGVNTKTKMIKRQMYGRAGFTLLRHRILLG